MPIKFLVLGGGGVIWFFCWGEGGAEVPILMLGRGKGGAKRTEKQNLPRMAPWKPFSEIV